MTAAPHLTAVALSNADIARRLESLAQLLAAQRENPYKIKAYRRAAEIVAQLPDSIDELVRREVDLTTLPGIGPGISSALREIVLSGNLRKLDALRATLSPEIAALSEFPRLDPQRVLQAYKKLGISSLAELRAKLDSGELGRTLGARLEHHVRQALTEATQILLYDADPLATAIRDFLRRIPGVRRAEITGAVRRRVEVIAEIALLLETDDFAAVVAQLRRYAGGTELLRASDAEATLKLSVGVLLQVQHASAAKWGVALLASTGAEAHVRQLESRRGGIDALAHSKTPLTTEVAAYRKLGLPLIPPELREGGNEVTRAARDELPTLIARADIRGELHCHTTASDGAQTIEQMAAAARERGYSYLGITDHSQSLKIAGGVSIADLRKQLRRIDRSNAKLRGIRLLKSAEVDILGDGTLDYPDDLLAELDYTVCSIHSRFGLNREQQTARILRAMDNPHFTILGHATGRLLLRRPGYEIDFERIVTHAKARGCFFEINSSPDRLDLSAAHARLARDAGIKIAIDTDAHSAAEFDFISCGLDVARRAGLEKADVLNCLTWAQLKKLFRSKP